MPIHRIPFDFPATSAKRFHAKSPAFLRIETALDYYLNQPPSWGNLKVLQRVIADWRATKVGPSIRDAAMQRLHAWMLGEIAALKPWPDREPGWDARHNCYAYAMHCSVTVNADNTPRNLNNARPGKRAGNPRLHKGQNFALGVLDDALHQGRQAWILRQGGAAAPIPAPTHGGYLVVMVSIPMGYHFMRRNNLTGLWTHKNGSIRDEETSWRDPDDRLLEDAIDDAALVKVITDPRIVEGNWVFDAYLEIQAGGLIVAG
jgi:hypothetical protein